MLEFISAVYNENQEVDDLIRHVFPYVDRINIVDDVSTDNTTALLDKWWWALNAHDRKHDEIFMWHQMEEHTGLPETVKAAALQVVEDGSWVLMLDADERFAPGVLEAIRAWLKGPYSVGVDYVYFNQIEIIDDVPVRNFQKCKLFKKEAMRFPLDNIHMDDTLTGNGIYRDDWVVLHRKSSDKQRLREQEYLDTYNKLYEDGKIDAGRLGWLRGLHHFVRD